jgi:Tfp pilus assembly protein PilF
VATSVARQRAGAGNRQTALKRFGGGALAATLALFVYFNALNNPFVYDDQDTVVANPSLADLSNVRFILTHSPFRPVVNVSYAIDVAIWGLAPIGFHLTNVLLHAAIVLLLYILLRRACADARARTASIAGPQPMDDWLAFGGAALFAVHPLLSEAVGYISGRSELLCGLFFVSAVLLARAATERGGRRWIAVGVAALLALLSKEVAVALPAVLLAYDWLLLPGESVARRRRMWFLYAPWLAVLALAAVYRLSVAAGPLSVDTPLLNMWTQAIVIWRYLALFFLPVGQSIMHGVHTVTSPADPTALFAVCGLAGLAGIAIGVRRLAPLTSFGILWFLFVIAPSSSIVTLREAMAEHRAYLASAGVIMALAGVAPSSRRLSTRELPGMFALAAVTVACLILAVLTVARNEVWADPVRLWREATKHAPGMWEPHYALADTLRSAGDCAGAIPEYETVVRMRPHHRDAHTNLGICLAQTNHFAEAEVAFRRALEIDPRFVRGYTNLGALALIAGQPEHARDMYLRALQIEPRNTLALMQLAGLYETVFKDFHAAARMCGEARAIAPTTPNVDECIERNQRLAAEKDADR